MRLIYLYASPMGVRSGRLVTLCIVQLIALYRLILFLFYAIAISFPARNKRGPSLPESIFHMVSLIAKEVQHNARLKREVRSAAYLCFHNVLQIHSSNASVRAYNVERNMKQPHSRSTLQYDYPPTSCHSDGRNLVFLSYTRSWYLTTCYTYDRSLLPCFETRQTY